MNLDSSSRNERLPELAGLSLKLGTTAFGGPAAHIAMMEAEVVRRRQWLTHEEFLDLLGAANLIPGPTSTELVIHIGHRRAGWRGLLVAGICFILPAALIVTAIAWAYVRFGKLPQVEGLLYGIKPVIIAVVAQALWVLSRVAVKTKWLALAGLIGVTLNFLGVNELIILFGTGLAIIIARSLFQQNSKMPLLGIVPGVPLATTSVAASVGLWPLFLFFLKVGSVLFGSGYVLLAFLRADLVERWHWLTENQLMDAVAVGQFTPGPVFTTATFIGYVLHGSTGAIVATVGIFLPAFIFVAISVPLLPRLRRSPTVGAFLDGVNVASLALMAVVAWQLGKASLVDWPSISLAVMAAFLLLRYKINSIWLVLGGAAFGLIKSFL
jgi:chromate transporter